MTAKIYKKSILSIVLFPGCMVLGSTGRLSAATTPATITINASDILKTINRDAQVGQNLDLWQNLTKEQSYQTMLTATDTTRFRYPGGALADAFHWNSNGSYDSNGIWHPSSTVFTAPGFRDNISNRGTTDIGSSVGAFPSNITDGDMSTEWLSDTINAQGINPWFYIDLGTSQSVNNIVTTWGTPYATSYKIESYTGSATLPYQDSSFNWNTVLTVTGASGGTDARSFPAVTTRFIRVEMVSSSSVGYAVMECQIYSGATLLSVHNTNPLTQSLCVAAPTSQANATTTTAVYLDFGSFMTFIQNYPGAVPIITVNLGTGTPAEAAAWVYYANVVKGYGIKHWEIGNEVEGVQIPGGPMSADYYAERFMAYAQAMKAVDPTIQIEGPVLAWLESYSHLYDNNTWTSDFFNLLQANSSLNDLNVLNFHDYPNWPNNNPATTLATYQNWANTTNAYIQNINSTYYPSSPLPVHLSEFNSGDATSFTVNLMNGLWLASYVPEFLKAWGDTGACSYWFCNGDMYQAGDGTWGDDGMFEGQNNSAIPAADQGQPRADYWATWLLKSIWMTGGGVTLNMVSTTSNQTNLPAWTLSRSDSHLTLLVVNIDPNITFTASVEISGYAPNPTATLYTYAGASNGGYYNQNYVWNSNGYNSYATTDLSPSVATLPGVSTNFNNNFPPYSITVFDFTNSNATFTTTPSFTTTPTVTPTPCIALFEGFESGVCGGYTNTDGKSTITGAVTNTQAYAGSQSLELNVATASGTWGCDYGFDSCSGEVLNMTGATQLTFWVKTDQTISFFANLIEGNVMPGSSPLNEEWESPSTILNASTSWQAVSFNLASFTENLNNPQCSPNCATTGDNKLDLNVIASMQVQFNVNAATTGATVYVDQIQFVGAPCVPPTATPTSSSTPSQTVTASPSRTASPTGTSSPSPSMTRSPTCSSSPSNTVTPSPTATASATLSASPSQTFSFTPTKTVSASSTLTATQSVTFSITPTETTSATATLSATQTWSFSCSPSPSASATATQTASVTPSHTGSPTWTNTPSFTPSSSGTRTFSVSPTASPSFSSSPTALTTPTFTRTPVVRPSSPSSSEGTVTSCYPALNPQSGPSYRFAVQLSAPSSGIRLRLYSRAMTAIMETEVPGSWHTGWNTVALTVPGLANGLYFVLVRSADEASFRHKPTFLMVIN